MPGLQQRVANRSRRRDARIDQITKEKQKVERKKLALGGQKIAAELQQTSMNNKGAMDRVVTQGRFDKSLQSQKDTTARKLQDDEQRFKSKESDKSIVHEKDLSQSKLDHLQEENEKDRLFKREEQKRDIAGQAFLGGMAGNQVQQIESSPDEGDTVYRGLKMPQTGKPASPWRQIEESDGENGKVVTGAFNQQIGERKYFLGGNAVQGEQQGPTMDHPVLNSFDPLKATPDQKHYLLELAKKNPEEYARVRKKYPGY